MTVLISIYSLLLTNLVFVLAQNEIPIIHEHKVPSYDSLNIPGKPVFDYRKNGWKIDVRVLPAVNGSNVDVKVNDYFPDFPLKEIGYCVLDFSITCVQKRIATFVEDVDSLDEIMLFGKSVKIVRSKMAETPKVTDRQLESESIGDRIDRSVDDFFDTHALRITLPKWNGKLSQINVMVDSTNVTEGRGKKGGGKGGGKCKKMMMFMVGMVKMKLMGMAGFAAMKGMMMAGMSLMISKMMLIMKLMSLKKGGGLGGGGGGGVTEHCLK